MTGWTRRARPLLGTLVDIGVAGANEAAITAAFDVIGEVQAALSRFDPASDIARFHALPAGACLAVQRHTAAVLSAAQSLHDASDGLFDVSLGSAPTGWRCDGTHLHKLSDAVRLDLGGIAKGYAVDRAVDALIERGCRAGWVNAGGDVRAFGSAELPLSLRDEAAGGVRAFATLSDGAFATSHFDSRIRAHASVAAPLCLWADALTKVVAISGDTSHPLLATYAAQAWLH